MLIKSGASLSRDVNNNYNGTGNCIVSTPPTQDIWTWIFSSNNGQGDIAIGAADTTVVHSLYWQLSARSRVGSSSLIIDGQLINPGQKIELRIPARGGVNGILTFENSIFEVHGVLINTAVNYTTIVLNIISSNVTVGVIKAMFNASNQVAGQGAIFNVLGHTTQADPRSNVVNGMCVYQPPLSVFDQYEGVFIGDMQLILTPNSNWKQCVVESAKTGSTYDEHLIFGSDFRIVFEYARSSRVALCCSLMIPQISIE